MSLNQCSSRTWLPVGPLTVAREVGSPAGAGVGAATETEPAETTPPDVPPEINYDVNAHLGSNTVLIDAMCGATYQDYIDAYSQWFGVQLDPPMTGKPTMFK